MTWQNGRFDAPDRLFVSISESWESVLTNPADLKELIPEFYALPSDFLVMRFVGHRASCDLMSFALQLCHKHALCFFQLYLWCTVGRD